MMKELKENIIQRIKANFTDAVEKNDFDYNRLDFTVKKETIPSILFYLKDEMGFIHLSHISCVDWIEEGELEVVFIVWSPKDKIKVFVRTRIDRDNPVMENVDMIWRQANTYERELREMFGVQFTGLVAPDEFILEDWQGPPPFRRDFDTAEYAEKTFWHRPGREDAQDVRETIANRDGEEIPDFAKKYSR
jgi:NADH-quinone oxidoreductase subunit C